MFLVGMLVPGGGEVEAGEVLLAKSLPAATRWPARQGIIGLSERMHLRPGELIDRFGREGGKTVAPFGTGFGARSLPPDYLSTQPYSVYRVLKPLEVSKGFVAPWFGQTGFGIQYDLPVSIDVLLRRGFIDRYIP